MKRFVDALLGHGGRCRSAAAPGPICQMAVGLRMRATVWFTGGIAAGRLPWQRHRIAMAAFVNHSAGSGGDHAAPVLAAILASRLGQNGEQTGK